MYVASSTGSVSFSLHAGGGGGGGGEGKESLVCMHQLWANCADGVYQAPISPSACKEKEGLTREEDNMHRHHQLLLASF